MGHRVAGMRLLFTLLLVAVSSVQATVAQRVETGFLDRTVTIAGAAYSYQVYVPRAYDPDSAWPVILFLHGAGERGADGLIQTEVGLGPAIRRYPERYPAIVVFPQAPAESLWQGVPAQMAMAALEQTIQEYNTAARRLYLTGLSMGGHGSWYLSYHYPNRFAAVVPICGWVTGAPFFEPVLPGVPQPRTVLARRLGATRVWVFHGESDEVVPVVESSAMFDALQAAGGRVRYTELPGIGHNSWDAAYGSPSFATWLLEQRLP